MRLAATPGVRRVYSIYGIVVFFAAVLFVPAAASAGAPGLQLTPLQYEDALTDKVKNGHVDVSNPTDSPIVVDTAVRGFRQQGTDGDLEFYDDADLERAVKVDLKTFELGPRDAVRVLFSVDPAKLPKGGVYAAIFFRTRPAEKASNTSYVSQSANVGTLLILRNGGEATPVGGITGAAMPFWQFGRGLRGSVQVNNTSSPSGGVAFRPDLTARVLPWGRATKTDTGLILPGNSRHFEVSRPGSYLGLLPVTISDAQTKTSRTIWVVACTGLYAWAFLVLLVLMVVLAILHTTPLARHLPSPTRLLHGLQHRLRHLRRRPRPAPAPALVPAFEPTPSSEPEPPSADPPSEPLTENPEPLPTVDPELTEPITEAESSAPHPGTLVMPEPETEPKPKVHKVKLQHSEPEPEKPKPRPKPMSKPKAKRKPKPKPEVHLRTATDIRPKRKPRP